MGWVVCLFVWSCFPGTGRFICGDGDPARGRPWGRCQRSGCRQASADTHTPVSVNSSPLSRFTEISWCHIYQECLWVIRTFRVCLQMLSYWKGPPKWLWPQSKNHEELFYFHFWKNLAWSSHLFGIGVPKTISMTRSSWMSCLHKQSRTRWPLCSTKPCTMWRPAAVSDPPSAFQAPLALTLHVPSHNSKCRNLNTHVGAATAGCGSFLTKKEREKSKKRRDDLNKGFCFCL